jgi:hypothetical protein
MMKRTASLRAGRAGWLPRKDSARQSTGSSSSAETSRLRAHFQHQTIQDRPRTPASRTSRIMLQARMASVPHERDCSLVVAERPFHPSSKVSAYEPVGAVLVLERRSKYCPNAGQSGGQLFHVWIGPEIHVPMCELLYARRVCCASTHTSGDWVADRSTVFRPYVLSELAAVGKRPQGRCRRTCRGGPVDRAMTVRRTYLERFLVRHAAFGSTRYS